MGNAKCVASRLPKRTPTPGTPGLGRLGTQHVGDLLNEASIEGNALHSEDASQAEIGDRLSHLWLPRAAFQWRCLQQGGPLHLEHLETSKCWTSRRLTPT